MGWFDLIVYFYKLESKKLDTFNWDISLSIIYKCKVQEIILNTKLGIIYYILAPYFF